MNSPDAPMRPQSADRRRRRVLVAGGSGFVGRHVVDRLVAGGDEVVILTRRPGERADAAVEVEGDVTRPATLPPAFDGVTHACYLVHSLASDDFEQRDLEGARSFAAAARDAGVERVVYLGGLGADSDDLSPHLRSRRDVERALADEVDTVALRAAIVVGEGGTSWEMLCQLVERLPVMITPRWVDTTTQPVALADVVEYVVRALDRDTVPAGHYDVGVPEPTTYREMMATVARLLRRPLVIVPVPVLTPRLSVGWVRAVTDVDVPTARALVESLVNSAEVTERRIEELTGHRPMTFLEAAESALRERLDRAAEQIRA